ncbi:MAG: DUF1697 domain-containing protein [Bacteroidales bacterium]|nr:DUF1697 domain-containing protein [Bacteroidales bacterium]
MKNAGDKIWIALLRGINVSGSNLLKMDELKKSLSNAGLQSLISYIQSGNLIFKSGIHSGEELENLIQVTILNDFGLNVPVLVKSVIQLEDAVNQNPLINESGHDIDFLHLTLLSESPGPDLTSKIFPVNHSSEKALLSGDRIYLYCPEGYGRTKFTNTFFEKKLKVKATTRNWKTLTRLLELSQTINQ